MILYLCLNRNLVCFILLIQVGRYVFIVKCCSCTSENALTYKYRCHWPPLSCIVCICYGTWYIFTSAFLTISTHEFPLNFHPSRAAPRSCVILAACSLPPRPEWFYMHGSASSTVHSESIRSWSCCSTFPALVMPHFWWQASCVRAGLEVEVVTLVPATGTQQRDPDRD